MMEPQTTLKCPECGSSRVFKDGHRTIGEELTVQRFKCSECSHRFAEQNLNTKSVINEHSLVSADEPVKNLVTQISINAVCAGDTDLLTYAWLLKKKRQNADNTINHRIGNLKILKRLGAKLSDPETVETILAVEPLTKAQKYRYSQCYRSYTKIMNILWDPPRIRYEPKEPFMPTNEEINALIYAANRQLAAFLQVALTTGARCGEIAALRWTDLNSEKNTICINEAEKGSKNRTVPVPTKTIAMLNTLNKKWEPYIFNPNSDTARANFCNLRKKLANTQQNPRLKQIHLHTFRHYFATETLRQTKMLTHVQYLLGHKSVVNTERYTHLVDFGNEKYYSAVAQTVDEIRQLCEDGWSYFQEVDGTKIFRKPK